MTQGVSDARYDSGWEIAKPTSQNCWQIYSTGWRMAVTAEALLSVLPSRLPLATSWQRDAGDAPGSDFQNLDSDFGR